MLKKNSEIVIDNQHVKFIETSNKIKGENENEKLPVIIKKKINTSTWIDNIKNSLNDNIILPLNCKLVKKIDNENTLFVIEEPPQIRTIKSFMNIEDKLQSLKTTGKFELFNIDIEKYKTIPPYLFKLSFPYIVYFITINNKFHLKQMKLFYRLSSITNKNDYLILNNLSNIDSNNVVCLGDFTNKFLSYSESILTLIDSWWQNIFNNDYIDGIKRYNKIEEFISFFHWQYYTSIDPMFIFRAKWQFHENSFIDEIHDISYQINKYNNHLNFLSDGFSTKKKIIIEDDKLISSSIESFRIIDDTDAKDYIISIGDEFKLDDEIWYIDLFLEGQIEKPKTLKYIQFKNEKGDIEIIEVNSIKQKLISLINMNNNSKLLTECTINGIDIALDDKIIIGPLMQIKIIKKIVFSNNYYEVMLDDLKYYILENLEFEKFDLSKIELDNVILNTNDVYNISRKSSDMISPITTGLKFIKFFENKGTIQIVFENKNTQICIDYFDLKRYKIVNINECKTPKIFYLFDRLFYNENKSIYIDKDNRIYYSDNKHNQFLNILSDNEKHKQLDNCFLNKDEIFIFNIDINIHLKVEDIVVIANWEKPKTMLIPQKIKKFEKLGISLIVHTETLDGQVKNTTVLIDSTKIRSGIIRKISFSYKNLQSGNVIQALETRISNFPKTKCYSIIGFLTEGVDEPMVLCSNLCTLWFSDVEKKFKLIKTKKQVYNISKFSDSAIINSIKYNIGDIITNKHNDIFILVYDNNNKLSRTKLSHNMTSMYSFYHMDNFMYYGFLTPRLTKEQQFNHEKINLISNMYGKIIEIKGVKINYQLINKGCKNV